MRPTLTLKKTQPPPDPKREFYEQVRSQLVSLYGLSDEQVSRLSTGCVSTILDTVQYTVQALTKHDGQRLAQIVPRALWALRDDHRYHAVLRQNSLPPMPPMPLWRVRKILEGVGPVLEEAGELLQKQQYQAEALPWLRGLEGHRPNASEIEWLVRVHRTPLVPEICQMLEQLVGVTQAMGLVLGERQIESLQNPPVDASQPFGPQLSRLETLLKATL